jgi:hypothetical protein
VSEQEQTPRETLEHFVLATEGLSDVYASPRVREAIPAVLEEEDRLRNRIKALTNPYQLGYKEGDAHGRKDAEDERYALREKLSLVTEDYIKERNAAEAAEAERDALRAEIDGMREREVDVARALDVLGESRVDLPRLARGVWTRAEKAEAALIAIRAGSLGLTAAGIAGHSHVIVQCDAALRDTEPAPEPQACCDDGSCPGHPQQPQPSALCGKCGYPLSEHKPHPGGLLAGRLYCDAAPAEEQDFSWFRGSVDKDLVQKLVDLERDTAPAEGFFARGEDGHYHPDPAPACPHGNPPGSARDCACSEEGKP